MESKKQFASVVYFLSRDGELEHPHFIKVAFSSPQGLFAKDVTRALNIMRGNGMASLYSWSSKRNYRKGYVWQDLSGDDFVHPCDGNEYILKGSLLAKGSISCRSFEASSSSISKLLTEQSSSADGSSSALLRRTNSWSTIDSLEDTLINKKIGKNDASTQTSDEEDSHPTRRTKLSLLAAAMGCTVTNLLKRTKDCRSYKEFSKHLEAPSA